MKRSYRSVFVSDFHLGSAASQAEALHRFLGSIECDYLYLVGDIIDGWVGSRDSKWLPICTDILRNILEKSNSVSRVFYTPGNHDAFLRRLNGSEIGNLAIDHSFVHRLLDGRDILVVHGDLFDSSCTRFKQAAYAGAWVYEYMTLLNMGVNRRRTLRHRTPVNFSASLKILTKKLVKKVGTFEQHLITHAKELGCTGVICGHIHRPQIEDTGFELYANTGDWVEHRSLLVEHHDGRLELIHWEPAVVYAPSPEFSFAAA